MMKIERILSSMALAALVTVSFNAHAASINADDARMAANNFLKQHAVSVPGTSFKAPALADIKLAHAEASSIEGNDYYVFNIQGGGWVIIAGDDRANQVLAYSDKGSLSINDLPENAKSYLGRYKREIEALKSLKGETQLQQSKRAGKVVEPLLPSINWAQQSPFNYQCPTYNGSRSSVGCAALAMAQIVNYWEYPNHMPALSGYQNSYYYQQVPSLEARDIDYDLIRDQYTTWTEDDKLAWVEGVTDEEKQEVAWLCRYCAQACLMNFSPDGSGSNVLKQKNAFMTIGYSSDAKLLGIEAWPSRETWNTTDYSDAEWTELMNAQLEAGRPIPYSCEDFSIGHAFVVDGVDAEGLYHVSWGWYGRGDGWFQHRAFNVTVQGEYMEFNDALFMVVDLYPYEGYVSPNAPGSEPEVKTGDVNGDGEVNISDVTDLIDLLLQGGATDTKADVNGDGDVNISDVTDLIDMLLQGKNQ